MWSNRLGARFSEGQSPSDLAGAAPTHAARPCLDANPPLASRLDATGEREPENLELAQETDIHVEEGMSGWGLHKCLTADQAPVLEGVVEKSELGRLEGRGVSLETRELMRGFP